MSIQLSTFETIVPSRFISFTIPNPAPHNHHLHADLLRVAVHDSPHQQPPTTDPPKSAVMLVPFDRESDWIFSTQSGHLQLLTSSSPYLSRLILIGNNIVSAHPSVYNRPSPIDDDRAWELEEKLAPLVFALMPKSDFPDNGFPDIPFLTYEDDVIRSIVVQRFHGSCVGEFLVEDVELDAIDGPNRGNREFRRRLRFKRMPNLIQTQIRIVPKSNQNEITDLEELDFTVDLGVLVHSYLTPMVAALSLISSYLDEKISKGIRPSALCLGVGGGALIGFLNTQLGFKIMGIDSDKAVLRAARKIFGLKDNEFLHLNVGNGIEYLKKFNRQEKKHKLPPSKFDVIMIDLDSSDATLGIKAPPMELMEKDVLLAARMALSEPGMLVLNVIPQSRSMFEEVIHRFKDVFKDLYEIDVGNGENFVLIALASPIDAAAANGGSENLFMKKLKMVISGAYIDSIRKL